MKTNRSVAEAIVNNIKVFKEHGATGRFEILCEPTVNEITQALDAKQKVIDVLRESLKTTANLGELDIKSRALHALARADELEQDDDDTSLKSQRAGKISRK